MIQAYVKRHRHMLQYCKVTGHAACTKEEMGNEEIVACAAVSGVVISLFAVLRTQRICIYHASAPREGYVEIHVQRPYLGKQKELHGITAMFCDGLRDIATLHRSFVELEIQ